TLAAAPRRAAATHHGVVAHNAGKSNILVIVVDALRADRLGCYGSSQGLTPFIDSLADRAFVFRRAYAQSSWTGPSVASLLTSRFQSQHGVVTFTSKLADSELTLPELLNSGGYATAGFSANSMLSSASGYAQGFDRYETPDWDASKTRSPVYPRGEAI